MPNANKRSISLYLPKDLYEVVDRHRTSQGLPSMGSAVNELLWIGIAATPQDGSLRAARDHLLALGRVAISKRIFKFFQEMSQITEQGWMDALQEDQGTATPPIDP